MNSSRENAPRRLALDILWRWEKEKIFARDLIGDALLESAFTARDRALITAAVNGVIRRKKTLDWLIDSFSPKRKPAAGSLLRQLLRLSVFQMLYLERIPDHAVLHQAGELARARLSSPEQAYVNALLRKLIARRDQLPFPPPREKVRYLSLVYSHPEWLISRWLKRWDFGTVEELCRTNNEPPPIFIRVNRLRIEPEELVKKLERAAVPFSEFKPYPGVLEIKPRQAISSLDSFRAGDFQVQDVSSLRVVDLLQPRPGESVADLCAAPGGKSSYIAEKMRGQGSLLAADADENRLNLLRDNFTRLGITSARIQKLNLLREENQLKNFQADKILLDVPCSNTGVLRRRVEARWRIRENDIERLAEEGLSLLLRSARFLKAGGRIVYSTCSLEKEENEETGERFLESRKDFALIKQEFHLPERGGGDGFYAAVLKRGKE